MSQNVPKATNALSPNLLGAHNTIFDGIVRPSGSLADGIAPIKLGAKGEATLPLRCKKRTYPIVQLQNSFTTKSRGKSDLRFFRVPSRKVVRRCRSF